MRTLLAMCAGLALSRSALAQTYTLISQTRTLNTDYDFCSGSNDVDSATAPDAEPFELTINSGNINFASQDSSFESRFLIGSGTASTLGSCPCPPNGCIGGNAASSYQASFSVAHPTHFHLVWDFWTDNGCQGQMNFSGPGGVIAQDTHFGTDDLSGDLAPGTHQFAIIAKICWGTCMGCQGQGPSHFDFTLELRRFGDADGDSAVDVDDLLAVINGWGECPPKAPCDSDLNGSGSVDADDLLEVINNWDS
jgi:hypothetical protein